MNKRTLKGLLGVAVGIGIYYRFGGEITWNAIFAIVTSSAGALVVLLSRPRWMRLVVGLAAAGGAVGWTLWTHETLRGEREDTGPDPTAMRSDPRVERVVDAWLLPGDEKGPLSARATGLAPRVDLTAAGKGAVVEWKNAPPQIRSIGVPKSRPWRFAVWADARGGTGVFEDVRQAIRDRDVAFSVGVGDLVGMARVHEFEILALQMTATGAPAFFVPGNHDLDPFGTLRPYARVLGPRRWHFVADRVLFVGLDSAHGRLTDDDATWAEGIVKARGPDAPDVVLFCHYPIFPPTRADKAMPQDDAATKRVQALAKETKALCFSGNWHAYDKTTHDGVSQYVSGGAGSKPEAPMMHHFLLVTVASDGLHVVPVDVASPADTSPRLDRLRVFRDMTAWTSHRMPLRFIVGWLLAAFGLGGVIGAAIPARRAPPDAPTS